MTTKKIRLSDVNMAISVPKPKPKLVTPKETHESKFEVGNIILKFLEWGMKIALFILIITMIFCAWTTIVMHFAQQDSTPIKVTNVSIKKEVLNSDNFSMDVITSSDYHLKAKTTSGKSIDTYLRLIGGSTSSSKQIKYNKNHSSATIYRSKGKVFGDYRYFAHR